MPYNSQSCPLAYSYRIGSSDAAALRQLRVPAVTACDRHLTQSHPTYYTREVPSLLAEFLSTVLEMQSLTHSRSMTMSASLCRGARPSVKQPLDAFVERF